MPPQLAAASVRLPGGANEDCRASQDRLGWLLGARRQVSVQRPRRQGSAAQTQVGELAIEHAVNGRPALQATPKVAIHVVLAEAAGL
jgi:hypothetical protein